MQCNVECLLPEDDVISKEPPMSPPLRGGTRKGVGARPPPRTPLTRTYRFNTFLYLSYLFLNFPNLFQSFLE